MYLLQSRLLIFEVSIIAIVLSGQCWKLCNSRNWLWHQQLDLLS